MKLSGQNNPAAKAGEDKAVAAILAGEAVKPSSETHFHWRLGLVVLVLGLGGFLLWAATAPLSQGVPTNGFIKVEGSRKTLQHLKGGIVDKILVQEGDVVKAGQPLVILNDTQLKSEQGALESQLISLRAMEARLTAEREGRAEVRYPEFLLKRAGNPHAAQAMREQSLLFRTRVDGIQGEELIANEMVAGLELQIEGMTAQDQSSQQQIKLFTEELDTLRPLYEQGFVPRNRMFELERSIAYLGGQRSENLTNIGRAKRQIAETRLKLTQTKSDYKKEVETQLTDVQRQAADLDQKLAGIEDDLRRVVMRASDDGVVVDLALHTVGGVVTPGQKLMDLVPTNDALLVEVQIPTHLIDSVHVGLDADVTFTALDRAVIPTVPGKLTYVSADRLTEPNKPEISYFIGRVVVTPAGMAKLGKHDLQPGMPAEVVIKTGQRTMLEYLLRPLLVRVKSAFTER